MTYLRVNGWEGPLLHYSVYDDSGVEMKEARIDTAALQAEALEKGVPWMSLLAVREGANEYLPEVPNAEPGEPVRLHYHDEFKHGHQMEEHVHPHNHAEEFAAFQKQAEALYGELQRTLAQLREHTHPFAQHQHPLVVHGHDPIEHQHPGLALLGHEHEMQKHEHPLAAQVAAHEHLPPEHEHPPHGHVLEKHDHPFPAHEHGSHSHDLEKHEHPPLIHEHPLAEHAHPHDHPEIYALRFNTEDAPEGHLHEWTRNTGKGWACKCGVLKDSMNG